MPIAPMPGVGDLSTPRLWPYVFVLQVFDQRKPHHGGDKQGIYNPVPYSAGREAFRNHRVDGYHQPHQERDKKHHNFIHQEFFHFPLSPQFLPVSSRIFIPHP